MRVTAELMRAVLARCSSNPPLDVSLSAELERLDQVAALVQRLERLERELRQAHLTRLKEVHEKLEAAREQCWHPVSAYHGDPAGGSDAYHVCDICGKVW